MDLRGQLPKNTFQYLVNTDGTHLYDGSGSIITSLTITNITSSYVTASYISESFINAVSISSSLLAAKSMSVLANDGGLNSIIYQNGGAMVISASGGQVGFGNGIVSPDHGILLFNDGRLTDLSEVGNSVAIWNGITQLTSSLVSVSILSKLTASVVPITASWAVNGVAGGGGSNLITGSTVPITSSWASSLVNYQPFSTIITSSTQWVTCSMDTPQQFVIWSQTASYSFTSSNLPAFNQVADLLLHISHSAVNNTSSLSFPSDWVWINGVPPTSITGSKHAFLVLHAQGTQSMFATWNLQL